MPKLREAQFSVPVYKRARRHWLGYAAPAFQGLRSAIREASSITLPDLLWLVLPVCILGRSCDRPPRRCQCLAGFGTCAWNSVAFSSPTVGNRLSRHHTTASFRAGILALRRSMYAFSPVITALSTRTLAARTATSQCSPNSRPIRALSMQMASGTTSTTPNCKARQAANNICRITAHCGLLELHENESL